MLGDMVRSELLEILCCPGCGGDALQLFDLAPTGREVEEGVLKCPACDRFYVITEGIPCLITEELNELVAVPLLEQRARSGAEFGEGLRRYIDRVKRTNARTREAQWSLDDVRYWEQEYGNEDEVRRSLEAIMAARPDAGNRTYPRERYLFSRLRPELAGRVMLDLGCGLAQTIRVICDPETVGYSYVGADLSFSALRSARRILRGDFVQCTADRPPFRVASVDAVVMLGTLHHLPDNQRTLERVVQLVRPCGFIAFHEVTRRGARNTRRWHILVGSRAESTHNEAIDAEAALAFLSKEAEILVAEREYSALRALLVRWLDGSMRRRPGLTRLVLWLDSAFLATIGRLSPVLGSHGILVLARKFPRRETEGAEV